MGTLLLTLSTREIVSGDLGGHYTALADDTEFAVEHLADVIIQARQLSVVATRADIPNGWLVGQCFFQTRDPKLLLAPIK